MQPDFTLHQSVRVLAQLNVAIYDSFIVSESPLQLQTSDNW